MLPVTLEEQGEGGDRHNEEDTEEDAFEEAGDEVSLEDADHRRSASALRGLGGREGRHGHACMRFGRDGPRYI